MAKADVSKEEVHREMVEIVLSSFAFAPLKDFKILFGGYSGTSIAITGSDGSKAVLKVCHGYTVEEVDSQVAIAVHARTHGFAGMCTALPRRSDPTSFTLSRADGATCCLLSWVDGTAADKVVSAGRVPPADVLTAVGGGLAQLHSVTVSQLAATTLRSIEDAGGCDLRKHINGELEAQLTSSEAVVGHNFLPFYERQLASLRAAVAEPGLPRGILHGDPFLDNVLVSSSDGSLAGFVDLEDLCIGPLLFDIACCASACCFRDDGALDARRLRALLTAYAAVRPLEPAESRRFVDFMKLTMLCNCTWRFKNFNIDHREIESCRDAHRELEDRILSLEDPVVEGLIQGIISSLTEARPATQSSAHPLTSVVSKLPWPHAQSNDTSSKPALVLLVLGAAAVALPAAVYIIRRR